ncbi:MAG: hypothetical protein ACK2T3_16080, partial [Candidatus Promineifilaceae bacterium]
RYPSETHGRWRLSIPDSPVKESISPSPPSNDGFRSKDRRSDSFVRLYPDLALGMLRHDLAAVGRVWLLLQYMDTEGRGWLTLGEIRKQLTDEDSGLHICGLRQLRKLLSRGDGLFWQRDDERLWLRSTSKTAAALGVRRLAGRAVALPISALLQGIGKLRAHFYASFHSGRNKESSRTNQSNLIARSTLSHLCSTSRRSQQRYEKLVGVESQSHIAIGGASSTENNQHMAWEKGMALFRFTDSAGKRGRKGISYSAWQLPNSYSSPHKTLPKGKQKRINRELADLFMKGMTGNGKGSHVFDQGGAHCDGSEDKRTHRLYHKNSQSAAANYERVSGSEAYWPDRMSSAGSFRVWFHIRCKVSTW